MPWDFPNAPALDETVTFPEGPTSYVCIDATTGAAVWNKSAAAAPPPPLRPIVTSIAPIVVGREDPNFTLVVTGNNFTATSEILLDFQVQTTTFISATEVRCVLSPPALGYNSFNIRVRNGTQASQPPMPLLNVIVHPFITSTAPATAPIAGGPFVLNITGDYFGIDAAWAPVVIFGGVEYPHAPVLDMRYLTVTVTPTGAPRTVDVQVRNGPVQAVAPPVKFTLT